MKHSFLGSCLCYKNWTVFRIALSSIALAIVLIGTSLSPCYGEEEVVVERVCLTMEVDGNGTTEPTPGDHYYDWGSQVDIQAIPDAGWRFVGWTIEDSFKGDVVVNSDSPITTVILGE